MFRKFRLFGAIITAALIFGSASAAFADRGCEQRIERAQYRLDRAVENHGFWSSEARFRRQELRQARDECRFDHSDRYNHYDRWGR